MAGIHQFIHQVVGKFPPMQMAFAYGSAIFRQVGYTASMNPMIDLMFTVDDAEEWHRENLKLNRAHYSFLGSLGSTSVAGIQRLWPGVYFNTAVKIDGAEIKYGVIETEALKRDLRTWDSLYVAGRLQKPVFLAVPPIDADLQKLLWSNREAALACAALMLPQCEVDSWGASRRELFVQMTGLSYMGDIRMGIAENSYKVENIVDGSIEYFHADFNELIDKMLTCKDDSPTSDPRYIYPDDISELSAAVPHKVKPRQSYQGPGTLLPVLKDPTEPLGLWRPRARELIAERVKLSSRCQTAKGPLTAGLFTSIQYAGKKIGKRLQSLPKKSTFAK